MMKIATIVRGYLPVPRPADIVYAPIDLAVALAAGLIKKGHKVDFYAPETSTVPNNVSLGLKPLAADQPAWEKLLHNIELQMHYIPHLWDYYLVQEMFERASRGEYDLLHFHHPEIAIPFASRYPGVPLVFTLHDPLYAWYNDVFEMYKSPNQFFVSISDSQRKPRPDLNYAATVYNGIDLSVFKPAKKHDGYLLFTGRIVPEKGVKEAVQVALKAGSKLVIAGPVFPETRKYFNQHIKPFLGEQIEYLGYVERDKLLPYYQKAKALIMPVLWEEPFGMNMIEAMACGTPVIAFRRGSVPEVVEDGKTGFIVDSFEEMAEAVKKIDTLDRRTIPNHVAKNFSTEKMVQGYEQVYKNILRDFKNPRP